MEAVVVLSQYYLRQVPRTSYDMLDTILAAHRESVGLIALTVTVFVQAQYAVPLKRY